MGVFNFNISGLNLVKNPGTSTDNSIARFNGTTGKEIQDSDVQLDDNGAFQNVDALVMESTPETAAGERVVRWNDTDGTIDIGLKGGNVTLQVGQESLLHAKSASSSGLVNGSVYRFVGSDGSNVTVELAQANASTALNTIGIATESVTGGNKGYITTFGLVRDINTSALTEGEIVWLSASVSGGMTTTQPANPNYAIKLGYCVRSHASQGAVFVTVDQSENAITAGSIVNSADEKTTPVDADMVGLMDSAASNVLKKLSWANIKTALSSVFAAKYSIVELNYTGGSQVNNSNPLTVQDVHSSTEFTITDLGWYEGEYAGNYTSAAITTGLGLGVYTGGGLTTSYFTQIVVVDPERSDKAAQSWNGANYILAAQSTRTTAVGGNHFVIRFRTKVTAAGTLRLRFINEVAGSAVTITSVIGMLKRIE